MDGPKPVKQSRQQALRTYCPNIYTVPKGVCQIDAKTDLSNYGPRQELRWRMGDKWKISSYINFFISPTFEFINWAHNSIFFTNLFVIQKRFVGKLFRRPTYLTCVNWFDIAQKIINKKMIYKRKSQNTIFKNRMVGNT